MFFVFFFLVVPLFSFWFLLRFPEQKIRKVVRQLIEAETGTDEASRSTGINVLADLLQYDVTTYFIL